MHRAPIGRTKWRFQTALATSVVLVLFIGFTSVLSGQTAFKNVNVVPINVDGVLENQTVLIDGGKIKMVGPADSIDIPDGVKVIDGKGEHFLMPGMMNSHAHLPGPQGIKMPVKDYLLMNVAAGITASRVVRYEDDHLAIQKRSVEENWIAPRLYVGAPAIRESNGVDYANPIELFTKYQKEGYTHIKYLNGLDPILFEALVSASHKAGLRFVGHLPKHIELAKAVEFRQHSIEHFQGYTRLLERGETEKLDKLIKETARQRVFNCPTVDWYATSSLAFDNARETLPKRAGIEFLPKTTVEAWNKWLVAKQKEQANQPSDPQFRQQVLKRFKDAGAPLLIGFDDGNYIIPGFGLIHEMKHFADAGFSNYEILKSATYNGAAFFDQTDEFGSIQSGMRADVVLLSANPLKELSNVTKVEGVMVDGRWYTNTELQEQLAKLKH